MKYYIGCSGYYYKEWKQVFYPEGMAARDWFKFYCKHFNTLEINSSFYRMPSPASLQKWYEDSPVDFLFSVKAPRLFTHLKRFHIDKKEILAFCDLVSAGLKEKLGCILFQMPPGFSFTPERLQLICDQLDHSMPNVVEFRHESWWTQEVLDTLNRHHIIFCGQSYPGNKLPEAAVVNSPVVYYRFHGKPVLYKSEYPEQAMRDVLEAIGDGHDKAFIYFNNTWGSAALVNSRQMQQLVRQKTMNHSNIL